MSVERLPLAAGDEVFAITTRAIGKGGRAEVEDAVRGRVVEVLPDGAGYRIEVTASGRGIAGCHRDVERALVWSASERGERAGFRAEVARFWGGAYRGQGASA